LPNGNSTKFKVLFYFSHLNFVVLVLISKVSTVESHYNVLPGDAGFSTL